MWTAECLVNVRRCWVWSKVREVTVNTKNVDVDYKNRLWAWRASVGGKHASICLFLRCTMNRTFLPASVQNKLTSAEQLHISIIWDSGCLLHTCTSTCKTSCVHCPQRFTVGILFSWSDFVFPQSFLATPSEREGTVGVLATPVKRHSRSRETLWLHTWICGWI